MSSVRRIKGVKKQPVAKEDPSAAKQGVAESTEPSPVSAMQPEQQPNTLGLSSTSTARRLTDAELMKEFDREFVEEGVLREQGTPSGQQGKRIAGGWTSSSAHKSSTIPQPKQPADTRDIVLTIVSSPKVQTVSFLKEIIQFVGSLGGPKILIFPDGIFSDEVSVSSLSLATNLLKEAVAVVDAGQNHLAILTCGTGAADQMVALSGIIKVLGAGEVHLSDHIFVTKDGLMLLVGISNSRISLSFAGETDPLLWEIKSPKKSKKLQLERSIIQSLCKPQPDVTNQTNHRQMASSMLPELMKSDLGSQFAPPHFNARFLPEDFPALVVHDDETLTADYLRRAASTLSRAAENSAAGTLSIHQLPAPSSISRDTIEEQLAPWLGRAITRQKHIELEATLGLPKLKGILPHALSSVPGIEVINKNPLPEGSRYDEDAFEDDFTPKPFNELSKMFAGHSPSKIEKRYRFGEDGEDSESDEEMNDSPRGSHRYESPQRQSQYMDTQTRDLMELENTWLEGEMMTHAVSPQQNRTAKPKRPFQSEPAVKKQPKYK